MMSSLVRYEVLLPLKYNDGRDVEESQQRVSFNEVMNRFGAATLEPQRLFGRWRFQGEEYEDRLLKLVVEVEDLPENHDWFLDWKKTLESRFDQIVIRITWHHVNVL
jgi:hypothetical protein